MFLIGITGGVGAGKSEIISILSEVENSVVLRSDDLAKELMEPGHVLHDEIARQFASDHVMDENGILRKEVMAKSIFSDDEKRKKANAIIHPEVKKEITKRVDEEKSKGRDFFFLEAALLLEDGYDAICDEIWYIYASEKTRMERLSTSRGYSAEKTASIIKSQLNEEEFRARCQRIIDNDGKLLTAREQVLSYVAELRVK